MQLLGDTILIVLEATGGLEVPLAAVLVAADLAVAVVNPRQVRGFAKVVGQLAKTDTLDAYLLARFAVVVGSKHARAGASRLSNYAHTSSPTTAHMPVNEACDSFARVRWMDTERRRRFCGGAKLHRVGFTGTCDSYR